MNLICIQSFGHFEAGDEVTVPDGAVYDSAYFEEAAAPPKVPVPKQIKEGD
jgi:hypothetical protein